MEIYGQTQNQSFGQMPQQNMVQNSMPMQQPGMMQNPQSYGQPGMVQNSMPMQQPYGQPGMVQNQNYEKPQNTTLEVIRSNYTTISLFEVSGCYDPAEKFPKGIGFVMGVPGVKDPSKQSGRTYNQKAKIVMKFSTQEIRSLGQSLINIATFKQAASTFTKHSDPSKNAYTQNNGQQQNTKKLEAKYDQAKNNIIINMSYGQNYVMVPVPLQDAFGLGHDLINIGNFTDSKLAEYKLSHKIGREEISGIDYDPVGTEDHNQIAPHGQTQGISAGYNSTLQQAPVGQYNPTMGQQYNPAMYQGMPGQQ